MLRDNRASQAIEKNHDAMWRLLCSHLDSAETERRHGVTVTSLGLPYRMFNFASEADIAVSDQEAALEFVESFFAERGVPWTWMIAPATKPSDLEDYLLERGYTQSHSSPAMALDLRGHRVESDEDVVEVVDSEGLEIWLDCFSQAFSMPPEVRNLFSVLHSVAGWYLPVRYFYVNEGGRPIAVSTVHFAAGVGGIYNVGTIPDRRKRGFGERITKACLNAVVEQGFDVATLHSSRMGLPLYQRLGFKEYGSFRFLLPPSQAEA